MEAFRLVPLPAPGRVAERPFSLPETDVGTDEADPERLLAAVAHDPFHPERRRPAGRYRLPGTRGPSPSSRSSAPSVNVHGLAVGPDRTGLVAVQIGGSPIRILRVGESHLGLSLTDVRPDAAVFSGTDTTLVLPLLPRWARQGDEGRADRLGTVPQ